MSNSQQPAPNAFDYEGCVTAGRATGKPIPLPSDEDLRRAEEAWNDPAFYDRWKDEGFVGAGWVPKPTVDPNRSLVPSESDIAKLPRWARVAFASRCARRVLPLFRRDVPNMQSDDLRFVVNAVIVAERAAATAQATGAVAEAADGAFDNVNDSIGGDWDFMLAHAVYSAPHAAQAAALLGDIREVRYAVRAAVAGLCAVGVVGSVEKLTAPARDFDRLLTLAQKEHWTDDTPVPASVFGPMWEGAPPEWWIDEPLAELSPPPDIKDHAAPTTDAVVPH